MHGSCWDKSGICRWLVSVYLNPKILHSYKSNSINNRDCLLLWDVYVEHLHTDGWLIWPSLPVLPPFFPSQPRSLCQPTRLLPFHQPPHDIMHGSCWDKSGICRWLVSVYLNPKILHSYKSNSINNRDVLWTLGLWSSTFSPRLSQEELNLRHCNVLVPIELYSSAAQKHNSQILRCDNVTK